VYEDFVTKGGLVEFWIPAEGDPELGGKLNFFFGGGIAQRTEQTSRNIEPVRPTVCADLLADMRVEVTDIAYRAR
jgi:hypothetical protein